MKISFVIPAYNEEKRIAECLSAVQKMLARGTYDTEIIVVNNASTDRTKEVALGFVGVQVVDESRKGLVWARRAGMQAATGELIANVDSDVILPETWLDTVVEKFEKDLSLVALSGPFVYYDLPKFSQKCTNGFYRIGMVINWFNKKFLNTSSLLQGGNYVINKKAFESIGGFDTSIEFYGEDIDVGRRLSRVGNVLFTFDLSVYTSGRRLKKEGVFATGVRYAINFFWVTFMAKPFTYTHNDVRHD